MTSAIGVTRAIDVIYTDLDGTMVGPRGCFFRAAGGSTTLEPARALVELLDAGVVLVLVSGRTRAQLIEAGAIFGAEGFVAELGAIVGWAGGREGARLPGAAPEGSSGADDALVAALLERYAGRLELHAPWHLGHEVDVMLRGQRGQVDVTDVERWLVQQGAGWLRLRDNGVLREHKAATGLEAVHVYHLVPDGISKGAAVAYDLARRGIDPARALAIGDSASDLEMVPHVGRMSVVANGARAPHMAALIRRHPNVVVEDTSLGAGWASAVRSGIAGRSPEGAARKR